MTDFDIKNRRVSIKSPLSLNTLREYYTKLNDTQRHDLLDPDSRHELDVYMNTLWNLETIPLKDKIPFSNN